MKWGIHSNNLAILLCDLHQDNGTITIVIELGWIILRRDIDNYLTIENNLWQHTYDVLITTQGEKVSL